MDEREALENLYNVIAVSIQGLPDHPWIPGAGRWPQILDAMEQAKKVLYPGETNS